MTNVKIKKGVQRAFVKAFDAEAERRGHVVRPGGIADDVHSRGYVMDTVLGRMRIGASGSATILHVYRQFEDVARARAALAGRDNFNPYSGKWNLWISGGVIDADARALVERAFAEVDRLEDTSC